MKEKFTTLASLANGEASKIFSEELEKLLANIADGRFPAGGKRKLELIVELEPDEDRKRCTVAVQCKTKGPARTTATQLFIRRHEGRYVGLEQNPEQLGLFEDQAGNILPFGEPTQ